jgi:hypothetical protein
LLWLFACGHPASTSTEPPEPLPDSAAPVETVPEPSDTVTSTADTSVPTAPTGPLQVQGVTFSCDEYDDVGGEELTAEAPQPGGIRVHHEAFVYDCWERVLLRVEATLDDTIDVTYEIGHSTADCTFCSLDLEYTLGNVPPGTWTVTAQGQAVEVTVQ